MTSRTNPNPITSHSRRSLSGASRKPRVMPTWTLASNLADDGGAMRAKGKGSHGRIPLLRIVKHVVRDEAARLRQRNAGHVVGRRIDGDVAALEEAVIEVRAADVADSIRCKRLAEIEHVV